jgi:hypothetical protein
MKNTEQTILNYLDGAHSNLVQAAKIAHLEKHPNAESISKQIDFLEDLIVELSDTDEQ